MKKDDLVYAGHMLDTARLAAGKVLGKTRTEYDQDENLRMALAHLIQTLGEAARRISAEFQHAIIYCRSAIGSCRTALPSRPDGSPEPSYGKTRRASV